DGITVHFKNLPRPPPEISQGRDEGTGAGEYEIQGVRNRRRWAITNQHVANHAASGRGKQREENKPYDVEIAPSRDGAANDAIEHNSNEIQTAIKRIDGRGHRFHVYLAYPPPLGLGF